MLQEEAGMHVKSLNEKKGCGLLYIARRAPGRLNTQAAMKIKRVSISCYNFTITHHMHGHSTWLAQQRDNELIGRCYAHIDPIQFHGL
jgi:hypothetical protein